MDFPWKRTPDECELCGARDVVTYRVLIEGGRRVLNPAGPWKGGTGLRLARAIRVCNRHPGQLVVARPVATPRTTSAPEGRHEQLVLFDSLPYRTGATTGAVR